MIDVENLSELDITTESENEIKKNLENLSPYEIIELMNHLDTSVTIAVQEKLPQIEKVIIAAVHAFRQGGRLFYIGSGTSGRLGIVDASECPPTFGVPHEMVIGIIAGGDTAIRKATEFAEDHLTQGWEDLKQYNINAKDIVIGLSASGRTPYVVGALKLAQENNIITCSIACNTNAPISKHADFPIEVLVGPEIITGSTRLKAGTAQKMILNMISTASMICIGKVKGNQMVDMQLSNNKLIARGAKIIMQEKKISYESAKELLLQYGSVRKALMDSDIS